MFYYFLPSKLYWMKNLRINRSTTFFNLSLCQHLRGPQRQLGRHQRQLRRRPFLYWPKDILYQNIKISDGNTLYSYSIFTILKFALVFNHLFQNSDFIVCSVFHFRQILLQSGQFTFFERSNWIEVFVLNREIMYVQVGEKKIFQVFFSIDQSSV